MFPDSREPIFGELRSLWPGLWSWTPLEPPEPGAYRVSVFDSDAQGVEQPMTIIAADLRLLPELMSAASLSQVDADERECCTSDEGAGEVPVACHQTLEKRYLVLDPGLSSASPVARTQQYLYRYTIAGSESEPTVLPWGVQPALRIDQELDEYCYEIEAIDLITGVATPFPELAKRCASLGELAEPVHRVMEIPDWAFASPLCPLPPTGFRMKWCDLNESHCEVAAPPLDCHYYGFVCQNEAFPGRARPDAQDAGTQEQEPPADSGPSVDPVDGGASTPAARLEGGGCTILRQRALAGLSHMLVVSFAVFALFARRARTMLRPAELARRQEHRVGGKRR